MNLADARYQLEMVRQTTNGWCEFCDHTWEADPDPDLVSLCE